MKKLLTTIGLLFALLSPAHALTANQFVTLFGSACPSQVQVNGICGSFSANFQTGTYWAQGSGNLPISAWLTDTRASSHLCQYRNGTWISVGNNVPCITDQGFLIEEARTNKCTNYNANPPALVTPTTAAAFNAAVTNVTASGDAAALFGVVDDSAAIASAGLQNVTNGRVYKIDNSAGTTDAFLTSGGTTGNTNAHYLSGYVRVSAFTGLGARIQLAGGGSGSSSYTTSSTYSRLMAVGTPSSSSNTFQIFVRAGTVAYAILNDLEEGSFVTSPIVTAGASATRAADVPQLIGPAVTAALAAKSAFFQTGNGEGITTAAVLMGFSGNGLLFFGSTSQVAIRNNALNSATAALGSGSYSGTVKSAFGFDAASLTAKANAGTQATTANAWDTGLTAFYLGNRSAADRALNGYMQRFNLATPFNVFGGSTSP